jgi:hypothetical protein
MAIKTVCKQNQYVSYFSVAAKEANHASVVGILIME